MMSVTRIQIWFLAAVLVSAKASAGEEVCRIRIHNKPGGLIQVSVDGGATWGAVGRVTRAANAHIISFAASSYTPEGAVAATAVHGIRIKIGTLAHGIYKQQMPITFSITPVEFGHIPSGYGGHNPRSSGIHTDIHAGRSIFRNFAPYVGSPVFLETDHRLSPLPEDYTPAGGETFVIVARRPDEDIRDITFENKTGGKVTITDSDGGVREIAEVVRPVLGTGRYDGTSFTGVGAINTNHGGVITISTAPVQRPGFREGGAVESRGGFMIQPYYHASKQRETSPQVMVIGPRDSTKPRLEGTAPLFAGHIRPSSFPGHPENSFRAQVRLKDGDWRPVPEVVGKADRSLKDVAAVRILFPMFDQALLARELENETLDFTARALESGKKAIRGTVSLRPRRPISGRCVVTYYLDGNMITASNQYPYTIEWDSTRAANGLHILSTKTTWEGAREPVVETSEILVRN